MELHAGLVEGQEPRSCTVSAPELLISAATRTLVHLKSNLDSDFCLGFLFCLSVDAGCGQKQLRIRV